VAEARLAAWLFVREKSRPPHHASAVEHASYVLDARAALAAIETGDPTRHAGEFAP
jgi:hypothetical protein